MTQRIEVTGCEDPLFASRQLELGNILFFPTIPFSFPEEEMQFLLQQKQSNQRGRKNIAYKPNLDQMTNHKTEAPESREKLKEILRNYSKRVALFLETLLPSYAKEWMVDYTSFRPFQEKGRNLRLRARNDLLHFDAFPTRPLNGKRILRFFTNINPKEDRHWITAEPFSELLARYMGHGLSLPKSVDHSWKGKIQRQLVSLIQKTGIKYPLRSPYDQFMLQFHNFLKEKTCFQQQEKKDHWHFPPGSCWAVFTDQVSHAALSGQYALEQTFLVPVSAQLFPEHSPLRLLERVTGRTLAFSRE
ncbi:MAG: Kdo hydroxylase family protein [Chlamydiia bacterium]|nr:Kdo hydroxylase family protein [Chlamydiia bacterium]